MDTNQNRRLSYSLAALGTFAVSAGLISGIDNTDVRQEIVDNRPYLIRESGFGLTQASYIAAGIVGLCVAAGLRLRSSKEITL